MKENKTKDTCHKISASCGSPWDALWDIAEENKHPPHNTCKVTQNGVFGILYKGNQTTSRMCTFF